MHARFKCMMFLFSFTNNWPIVDLFYLNYVEVQCLYKRIITYTFPYKQLAKSQICSTLRARSCRRESKTRMMDSQNIGLPAFISFQSHFNTLMFDANLTILLVSMPLYCCRNIGFPFCLIIINGYGVTVMETL